jgi:hypothetical protein
MIKCQMCGEKFFSTEWFKDEKLFKMKFICCDECLLRIYDARMDVLKSDINFLGRKIIKLQLKINNEQYKNRKEIQ